MIQNLNQDDFSHGEGLSGKLAVIFGFLFYI